MAKTRQAVAASAIDELLLNQAAAMAQNRPSAAVPEARQKPPAAAAPARELPAKTARSARPQQAGARARKPRGEDGGKVAEAVAEDTANLFAKIPADLMKAVKLHLLFHGGDIKDLVCKVLADYCADELEEVQARASGAGGR